MAKDVEIYRCKTDRTWDTVMVTLPHWDDEWDDLRVRGECEAAALAAGLLTDDVAFIGVYWIPEWIDEELEG